MNELPLDLKDIHLPTDPSWWPPAPGWWLLSVIILLLAAVAVWRLHKRHKQKQLAAWLNKQLHALEQAQNSANSLHSLLRNAVCSVAPSLKNASQYQWQQALQALAQQQPIDDLITIERAIYQPVEFDQSTQQNAITQARPLLNLVLLNPKKAQKRLEVLNG